MGPKVNFVSDPDKLANYLCYLGKQIACGFYQDRRFLVLPKLIEHETRAVYFPGFGYSKNFWQQVGKFGANDFVFKFDKETVVLAKNLLRKKNGPPRSKRSLQQSFQIHFNHFSLEPFDNLYDVGGHQSVFSLLKKIKNRKNDF